MTQQIQAELNQTALELVRTQRELNATKTVNKQLIDAVLELAKTQDKSISTIEDAVGFLQSLANQLNPEEVDAE